MGHVGVSWLHVNCMADLKYGPWAQTWAWPIQSLLFLELVKITFFSAGWSHRSLLDACDSSWLPLVLSAQL